MLELRPTCEHCNTALPPDSALARICSFECTFCAFCVDGVLGNVCPNCGGGFEVRPVRPAHPWKGQASLAHHPASDKHLHRPVDPALHAAFSEPIRSLPPGKR
jgi:hypothetical protein